jgi:hypothetical protein
MSHYRHDEFLRIHLMLALNRSLLNRDWTLISVLKASASIISM